MKPDRDFRPFLIFLLMAIIIICVGLFTPVREKIQFRIDELKSQLFYMRSDPANTMFVPGQSGTAPVTDADIEATISQYIVENEPTDTPVPTATLPEITEEPTATEIPTNTPAPTPTPEPLPNLCKQYCLPDYFQEGMN